VIINLSDIGPQGDSFSLNRESGELNAILSDLIGENNYDIQMKITPKDHGFELVGSVRSQTPELCSRCGIDIQLKISKEFKELLLPKIKAPGIGEHYSRVNHYTDLHDEAGPGVIECDHLIFDAGEYLHELIALQIPARPVGETNEVGDCLVCGINTEKTKFGYEDSFPAQKENPFSALKNIKLN